jgi:hypothetical protein
LGMDLCWIGHFMGEKTTTNWMEGNLGEHWGNN